MSTPLVIFQQACVQWSDASAPLFRGISWELHPGDAFQLLGPSGLGKTTFLRLTAGLLKPTRGRVLPQRGLTLGYAFQEPRLLPWLTLRQNLTFAHPQAAPERIEEFLRRTGLLEKADQKAESLSGGEAQRGNLLRALLGDPQLLLLDEPFSAMDPQSAKNCQGLLEEWRCGAPKEKALLLVTHQDQYRGLCGCRPLSLATDGPQPTAAE
jgi:sulfonate transport system ATP-binding protein